MFTSKIVYLMIIPSFSNCVVGKERDGDRTGFDFCLTFDIFIPERFANDYFVKESDRLFCFSK